MTDAGLERFAALVAGSDARIDLAAAALMIAEDAYPSLEAGRYLGEIERMANALRGRLPQEGGAEATVLALNRYLFDELGFRGNTDQYYDPRNSYLNEVIDRRTGIPITLGVLYMEVGRRIGLPLQGVSFPGHFLVRLRLRGGTLVLDPFCGGAAQSEAELAGRLEHVLTEGERRGLGAQGAGALPLARFLEPASKRQILARMLRNLKGIYRDADQPGRLLGVLNRILVLSPGSSAERRERGLVYQRLECFRPALQDLTDYLTREPGAPDRAAIGARVAELSALCARLN